ncbi:uncharacterized protein LOC121591497 isoform X2 [Anopheles merus]|uniref:uncharacterized protein LOC121591497 isoform X2 n=1 Tax=Anopheles merus TaxID=30066 RepID=UPI001BE44884|nr:uncharacterized protein LOC121591497 isoform X2 [Anopheles merus]
MRFQLNLPFSPMGPSLYLPPVPCPSSVTPLMRSINSNDYSSGCYRCWSVCRYCGGWHLTFPYVALGIALIVWPHRLWLSHVAGGLLIGLAMLRLLTVCKFRPHGKDDELLNHCDEHADKYDNLSDVLVDNSMPEPGHSLEGTNGSSQGAHDDGDDDDDDDDVAINGDGM